jgi:ribonuclease P protein component
MLKRQHRFHGYSSLQKTYPRTKIIRGNFVSLRYVYRLPGKPYRVAVVVGRKVNKSAVKRNRIRRRIYEVVRTSTSIPLSIDLIFNVYSDQTATIEAKELTKQINELIEKIPKR